MKKILCIAIICVLAFSLASCKNNNVTEDEVYSELISEDVTESSEVFSSSEVLSQLDIENFTSAYIEPNFRTVADFDEVLTYFETQNDYASSFEYDENNRIISVETKDKNNTVIGTVAIKYKTESKVATISIYENGEYTGKKLIFSFNADDTLTLAAVANSETNIALYLYNDDGSPKAYIDSDSFSNLITSAFMNGLSGLFS